MSARLPRNLSGAELIKALNKHLGYLPTRQRGSHIRITTQRDGENHEAVPLHQPLKIGTLASILKRVAARSSWHGVRAINGIAQTLTDQLPQRFSP